MTSNHFFDKRLAFGKTFGANIGQLDLDTELGNHYWSTTWSPSIPAGIKRLLTSFPMLGVL